MALKARVKVSGVTSLSEARYCAGMGVELLGFPVGTGGLSTEQYKQIIDWISGPELVLEATADATAEEIRDGYPGHFIQISAAQLDWLNDSSVQFIVSILPEEWPAVKSRLSGQSNIAYVLLETSSFDLIAEVSASFPLLIATDNPTDVERLAASPAAGIALTGTKEEKPGLQDYSKLATVLEKLEVD